MIQALLAAEADKIQDFIFRAAHLREVTGGSALLTRFCDEIPTLLRMESKNSIIHDGGNFRLAFDSESQAIEAGTVLADLYYQMTGCSLTVAPPVAWDGSEGLFKGANEQAGSALRSAKRTKSAVTTAHLPYTAFCASTGIELAASFEAVKLGQRENYVSQPSLFKNYESKGNARKQFLDKFLKQVVGEDLLQEFDCPDEADQVGRYDPRNYVAYMVADGNGMGAIFGECKTAVQLSTLSKKLSEIVRESLAIPSRRYLHEPKQNRVIPVLPMILGGDDLFVLLPAPTALAFAQEFCQQFEQKMAACLQKDLGMSLNAANRPTMSVAIVICKASYPFQLAHEQGESILKAAKRFAKLLPQEKRCSTINVQLIVGSQLGDTLSESNYYPHLGPCRVGDSEPFSDAPGTTVATLLTVRRLLDGFEQKPRAQLEALFDYDQLQQLENDTKRKEWQQKLEAKVKRIGSLRDKERQANPHTDELLKQLHFDPAKLDARFRNYSAFGKLLIHLLTLLGDNFDQAYWRNIGQSGEKIYGNALPRVFELWNYLQVLPTVADEKEQAV